MSITDVIMTGMNNPDCAFYVGAFAGNITTGGLIFRIALIYFGMKLIDKIVFLGIPKLYNLIKKWRKNERK